MDALLTAADSALGGLNSQALSLEAWMRQPNQIGFKVCNAMRYTLQ